jgi:tetratricopeptide (TPR) repeat protein
MQRQQNMRWVGAAWLLALMLAWAPAGPRVAAAQGPASAQAKVSRGRKDSGAGTTRPATPKTLSECEQLYREGSYAEAAGGYRKLLSERTLRVSAAIGLARAQTAVGGYGKAIETLEGVSDAAAARADWHLALAEALETVGRYDEALTRAAEANTLRADWAPTIDVRGRLLETLGRREDALAVYETMKAIIAGEAYRRDARSLLALGRILDRHTILTGRKASEQAANILHNYYQEAYQKVDQGYWQANVAAGMFLLAKHRPKQAKTEFELALKSNEHVPDAYVGLGAVALDGWDFETCVENAEKALKINPRHCDGHLLKAVCFMLWRKFDLVAPAAEKVLAVNPNHLEALSLMAALHIRTGEAEKARPYMDRVRKVHPRYAGLPMAIGQWLAAGRQFAQAEEHYKQAIEAAPYLAEPYTSLGRLYMQTGEEGKAEDILKKAHELDDFRADVVNFLRVLDRLKGFRVKQTPHFIVKVDPDHDLVLLDQMADYMEQIHGEVCGDFSHEPAEKTIVEIMPTHKQFSIRIAGRAWIGTVGASTGRVIVIAAPDPKRSQLGRHNWATVMRHEYTHTVTLSATKNRIPHWFTEACAVWQQPDKRNYRFVRMLVSATRRGKLLPIKELDWGFIRPQRRGDRMLAYAQAEWAMEYIIERYGFARIAEMLAGFRDGLTQPQVFVQVLGTSEAGFDGDFRAWAKRQVKSWGFNPDPPPEPARAAAEAKLKPNDAAAQAEYAVALYYRGKRSQAERQARKALDLDGDNVRALAVLAYVLSAQKRYDEAIKYARRLEGLDHTSTVAPRALARCYLGQRQWIRAIAALELLKQRQPLDSFSYEQLAGIYTQFGQPEKALPNLLHLHRHTLTEPKYARQIAEVYRTTGRDDQALSFFRQVIHINPYEASAYQSIAAIHLDAGRYDEALAAAETICLLQPDEANSWNYMAVVRYRAGKAQKSLELLQKAREAVERSLKIEPEGKARQILESIEAAMEGIKAAA